MSRADLVADTFCDASTPALEALTRESIRVMRQAAAIEPAPHAPPMFGYGVRAVFVPALGATPGRPEGVRCSGPAWGVVLPGGAMVLVPNAEGRS